MKSLACGALRFPQSSAAEAAPVPPNRCRPFFLRRRRLPVSMSPGSAAAPDPTGRPLLHRGRDPARVPLRCPTAGGWPGTGSSYRAPVVEPFVPIRRTARPAERRPTPPAAGGSDRQRRPTAPCSASLAPFAADPAVTDLLLDGGGRLWLDAGRRTGRSRRTGSPVDAVAGPAPGGRDRRVRRAAPRRRDPVRRRAAAGRHPGACGAAARQHRRAAALRADRADGALAARPTSRPRGCCRPSRASGCGRPCDDRRRTC